MNRRETELLVENWRKLLKESIDDDWDDDWDNIKELSPEDSLAIDKEDSDFIMNWGDNPGYLPVGSLGKYREGYPKIVMKVGEELNQRNNPVYALLEKLFSKYRLSEYDRQPMLSCCSGGGKHHLALLKDFVNEGCNDYPQIYTSIFVEDENKRNNQVKVVFDCLQEELRSLELTPLRSERYDINDTSNPAHLKMVADYKEYINVWSKMNKARKTDIIWKIINKLSDNKLLPQQLY